MFEVLVEKEREMRDEREREREGEMRERWVRDEMESEEVMGQR